MIAIASIAGAKDLGQGLSYEHLARYDIATLNDILEKKAPEFSGSGVTYTKATNAVNLYRVTYASVIPEKGNLPTVASGLIAIPELKGASALPLLSYQHGTVMGKTDVPSFIENSMETKLVVAQFAGQGYVVIAADYFGMGASKEKEGYIVLQSQRQACTDLLRSAKAILASEGIQNSAFFTCGWSEGGVVTMSWLEQLENFGMGPAATGTAAAQCDPFAMVSGLLYYPRPIDAQWVTAAVILTAFSFEEYYSIPGLAAGLFTPEQYEIAKKVYLKEPYDEKDYPSDFKKLVRSEYFDPTYFENSKYGRLLQTVTPYRWNIKTPVKMYYGGQDESLKKGIATLPATYQTAYGNDRVSAILVSEEANHRQTFAYALQHWKEWFDTFAGQKKQPLTPPEP